MIKTTQYRLAVDCLAALSPWWLLLAVPLALGLMAWLYWRQTRGLRRAQRGLLLALRLAAVAVAVCLMFRPRVEWRRTTDYGGRCVVLVDNSLSMGVPDTTLSAAAFAGYARRAGLVADDNPYYRAALDVDALRGELLSLRSIQTGAFTESDRYWDLVASRREAVAGLARAVAAHVDEDGRERIGEAEALFADTVVDAGGAREATRRVIEQLGEVRDALTEKEAALDEERAAAAALDDVRTWTRLDVVGRMVDAAFLKGAERLLDRQRFTVRLLHDDPGAGRNAAIDGGQARAGGSDVVAALTGLLAEQHKMPLSTVLVVSDGRWSGFPVALNTMLEMYRSRGVSIHTLGVGAESEAADLAVLRVFVPEFGVARQDLPLQVLLKTAWTGGVDSVRLVTRVGGQDVDARDVAVEAGVQTRATVTITVDEPGVHECTVSVEGLEGELTYENNAVTVPVEVLDRRIRVLYLEQRPHWQARFVANVLSRLPHVELNRLVVLSLPDSVLPRGVGLGTWPESPDILDLYDVVIVGDVEPGLLSAAEWEALTAWTRRPGHTLAVVAGDRHMPGGYAGHTLAQVLPVTRLQPVSTASVAEWVLMPEGAGNRMTRGWRDFVREGTHARGEGVLAPESVCLLAARGTGDPLLAWRKVGAGKSVVWMHPQAWSRLNAEQLDAHTGLWVDMITWARRMDLSGGGLVADGLSFSDRTRFGLLKTGGAPHVRAVRAGGGAALEWTGMPLFGDVTLFPVGPLSPGEWTLASGDEALDVAIVEREPEYGLLSRHVAVLEAVASGTGGRYVDIGNAPALVASIEGKTSRESERFILHVWRHWLTIALFGLLVAAEWILRKWMGKV